MTDWPLVKTSQLIKDGILEIGDGYRAKNSEMGAPGLPFIRAGDVNGKVNTADCELLGTRSVARVGNKRSRAGDVVLTTKGTVGRVAYVDTSTSEFVYSPQLCFWRSLRPDRLVPRFIFYSLQSDHLKHQMGWSSGQTDMAPYISLTDQRTAFELRLPVRGVQTQISEVLGSLDDKIELNQRMNETLEAMAQAIFRDWFVDFGPSRRKLEGATDPLIIMGGLVQDAERAQALADLFPAALGDDGLPEGWAHRPFGSLLSDTIGGDWGKDTSEGENAHPVAIIRGTDFPELEAGGVGKVPTRFTTVKKAARRKLLPSDILIEVSGGSPTQPTGRSIFITQSVLDRFSSDVVCASFCRRFRAVSHDAAVLAFEHLRNLYSEGGTWEYQHQSTGISNFQTTHFLEAEKVVFPGEELMEHFASLSGPMIEARYRNESMTLAATRDLLLPKLMSGEIRLSEAEGLMEAAQ